MAVRITFPSKVQIPEFFSEEVKKGSFGMSYIEFPSVDTMEQAVVHSELMDHLPAGVSVTDLHVYAHSEAYKRIGGDGTYHFETDWGQSRIVITGATIALEATDPRSFLAAHRAILNDLVNQEHRVLHSTY